ncbi:signal transduction histidine kinase [Chryseobacterium bernardetii]|uniref:histidine kinase n=2 Tax=Chryseobacterium TaxID=59732 RepID=A0A543EL52_9FLAO|nr:MULTISPECIES: HAMP domain-containing sensor histidine kinase [Chryseobacterium]MDR6372355.1 signal transduction histidine kinase [Chryseobacterium vietnamense]MDR6442261.1 signal transduction histidine kinase [Chryseobacterium bernardetii]TQM22313.1 histidine kinase/DNA gyrase B/HSP90-like ATPase [Chryseobacterium aquifrigidense]
MNDLINELQLKIEKLENEINFKNGLISILSHDSKELFGTFLWLTEELEQKTLSEEDFFKLLPQVKRDTQKNLQTIQDSVAWLKTQYGEFQIKPVKIIVMDLFHYLEEKYAAKLKEKNINFYYKGDHNASLTSDRLLLEYVLDKIFNNAVKYSFDGQDVYLQAITEGDQVVLSVIDSGTGIHEKYLPTIYNYDNPVFLGTAGEKGVGLSLKIVKNFISLLYGNIQIISAENKGTTVSLFLHKFIE